MKNFIIITILFFHLSIQGQVHSGTYQIDHAQNSKILKLLRIKLINDSTLIFAFSKDTSDLNFNISSDFGICHLKNNEWIGLLDYSPTVTHEYGDFMHKEKRDMSYIIFRLTIKDKRIGLNVLDNNTRVFVGTSYHFINKIPLSSNISNKYKRLGLRRLIYKPLQKAKLYCLPENIMDGKKTIDSNEFFCVENEYKNYVFIVKYNEKNEIEKSGWVDRSLLVFVKKEMTNDRSHTCTQHTFSAVANVIHQQQKIMFPL